MSTETASPTWERVEACIREWDHHGLIILVAGYDLPTTIDFFDDSVLGVRREGDKIVLTPSETRVVKTFAQQFAHHVGVNELGEVIDPTEPSWSDLISQVIAKVPYDLRDEEY